MHTELNSMQTNQPAINVCTHIPTIVANYIYPVHICIFRSQRAPPRTLVFTKSKTCVLIFCDVVIVKQYSNVHIMTKVLAMDHFRRPRFRGKRRVCKVWTFEVMLWYLDGIFGIFVWNIVQVLIFLQVNVCGYIVF